MVQKDNTVSGGKATTWRQRAKSLPHKPNPHQKIPELLHDLGDVFFPIPRGKKGWNYPHHMDEYRFGADSEILNAYFEAGWGYGISCAGDITVVDVDNLKYLDYIIECLPETAWQMSGSGEGYHLFYKCPGLNTRINLMNSPTQRNHVGFEGYGDLPRADFHIGEVKCDPHGYVVGPGSVHPSGNKYGPLNGDSITEISKEELQDALVQFSYNLGDSNSFEVLDKGVSGEAPEEYTGPQREPHELYQLKADAVTPWLTPGTRVPHPVHGSSTDSNFMMNEDKETYTCWRCQHGSNEGCGINPAQLLAMIHLGSEAGKYACESIRAAWSSDPRLHYYAWREAIRRGLVERTDCPYRVFLGFALEEELIEDKSELEGDMYIEARVIMDFYQKYRWE